MVKDMPNKFSEVTPEIKELAKKCNKKIDEELFAKYDVKRGLRKRNGEGVLAGLTDISMINAYTMIDREIVPCEGKLYYRGIDIEDIVKGFIEEDRFGFEETAYLLLFGELPKKDQLKQFEGMLGEYRQLPTNFVRDIIMKAPSCDMMNTLARSVLTLFSYDDNASDISLPNVLRQCIQLIALFPVLSVYAYQAYNHYERGESLFIHLPDPELSTAENILHLLRPDSKYTKLEAKLLDMALVLHAEHGGGNNSTFTTHVVSSSGTDTYSAIAAALCSLKGPKHGGANIKVVQMFDDLKANVKDWSNEEEIREYLLKLLNKEAFDKAGLIYGMGHAVYSLSDPRSKILSRFVKQLSEEKGKEEEYQLYTTVERLAKQVIGEKRKIYKGVSANIDFYSGFIYSMLGLPHQLYTPLFAIARIVGWSAHRMEELINGNRIIRPAYKAVEPRKEYTPINEKRLPTGEICDVAGTAMDFREFHDIGSRIGEDDANVQTVSGYDHNYILPGNPGEICYAAAVRDPESRRIVEVYTDMPGVQLYTAKELVEQGGKGGITYGNFGGLCFETQQYPNGINEPKFPSPILKAGETFESTTVFRFGIY